VTTPPACTEANAGTVSAFGALSIGVG